MNTIKVAILGLGTVGTGVYKLIQKRADVMERTAGAKLEVKKILVAEYAEKSVKVWSRSFLRITGKRFLRTMKISVVYRSDGVDLSLAKAIDSWKALEAGKNVRFCELKI